MTMPQFQLTRENARRELACAFARLGATREMPKLLLAMPPLWNNRSHSLWYSRARLHDYEVRGIVNPYMLEDISWPGPIILHCHWFSSFINNAPDKNTARRNLDETIKEIEAFRERAGALLLWTAHNIYPHLMKYPECFRELRRWIFSSFDAVHYLGETHRRILEEEYGLPSPRSFTVPTSLYTGAQPDCIEDDVARAHWNIPQDAYVFGLFGSIEPYKGIDAMLDAIERLGGAHGKIAALVAGMPRDAAYACELERKWGKHPGIRLEFSEIPDYAIQYVYRACDAMVMPYVNALNSGAAFLGATFSKTLVMPKGPLSQTMRGLGVVEYDPENKDALQKCLLAVAQGLRGQYDSRARAAHAPENISRRFFESLDKIIAS